MYADAVQSLTLERPQLPIAPACRTDPTRAVSCLREMEQALRGVIRGENKYGNVALRVQGTNPARAVTFVCKGLTGCKADLDRFIRNRTQHLQQIGGIKQQYVTQVRTNANKVVTDGRAALAPRINELRDRLRLVARALSAARVPDPSLDVGSIPSEELQFDEKGLPIAPQSVLGLLGAGAGGADGIPNINEAALLSAGGRVTAGREEISRQRGRIGSAIAAIQGLQQSCPRQAIETLLTKAEEAAANFESSNCRAIQTYCVEGGGSTSSITALSDLMASIAGRSGTSFGSEAAAEDGEGNSDIDSRIASLSSGVANLCPGEATEEESERLKDCACYTAQLGYLVRPGTALPEGCPEPAGDSAAIVALSENRRCGARTGLAVGQNLGSNSCATSYSRMSSYLGRLNSALGRGEAAGDASGDNR